jgi:oligogalacturonide transport system permease protein
VKYKRLLQTALWHLLLIFLSLPYVFPLLWMVLGSFKTNEEIFLNPLALPQSWSFQAYRDGWNSVGQYSFGTFFKNTFVIVVPVVLFTLVSAMLVAYGFARFEFKGKGPLFSLMISTMMLPAAVTLVPKYILFNSFGWIDTYLPLIVPAVFGGGPFFIFMLMQFFRGVPRELDEAAIIDGCASFAILTRILLPLSKAALFTAGIFQFLWTWNDFFNQLIYINSVSKYTISQGLRMALDLTTNIRWNKLLAMSVASIAPLVVLYFFAQRYFVEGIATTGLKG